eukprot:s2961_g1.t1
MTHMASANQDSGALEQGVSSARAMPTARPFAFMPSSMGGVASAGKLVAKSVAKPFKRKAAPQAPQSSAQSSAAGSAGGKGPAGTEPRAAGAAVTAGSTARAQSVQRGSGEAEASQRGSSKSSKSSKIRREESSASRGGETPKTLAAEAAETVPAFGAVDTWETRPPDGSNTPEQESPMKAGATPKPTTREVPEPWVKVAYEDDFYFWNTQTDETTWDIEDCFASITPREEVVAPATGFGGSSGGPAAHWAAAALGLDSGSSEEELGQVASEMREAKAWPSGGSAPLPAVESKPEVPLPPGEWLQPEALGVESEEEAPAAPEATWHPAQPAHEVHKAHEAHEEVVNPAVDAVARLPDQAPESQMAAEQLAAGPALGSFWESLGSFWFWKVLKGSGRFQVVREVLLFWFW